MDSADFLIPDDSASSGPRKAGISTRKQNSTFSTFVTSFLSGQNDERKSKAALTLPAYLEYTDINAESRNMEIHQLHRDLPPHMWGVTLQDLDLFESEVRNAIDLGIIVNSGSSQPDHNAHMLDPTIGPNIYQVNHHYIKPVTWHGGGMSFALMLNPAGLKCDVFATHAWCEGIFEFVDRCKRAWPRRHAHSLWCCFLANPQNSDISKLLSGSVFDSPFAKAIQHVKCVVVLPNHDCSIYTRLWCVLEAKLAIEYDLDIVLMESLAKRNMFVALLPTIAVGLLVYGYTLTMCYLWYLRHFGLAVAFVASICAPMIVAAGVYYYSQGRFVRVESHARMMILACISSILYALLYNSAEFLEMLFEYEHEVTKEAGACRFREVLNTTTDAVILMNIVFIALATTYKQAKKRKVAESCDSSGDDFGSDTSDEVEDDENDNAAGSQDENALPSRDLSREIPSQRGILLILAGEIIFLTWFLLELAVRLIGSYAECKMLSLGNFVLELVLNISAALDIYLTCQSRHGSQGGRHMSQRGLACFGCCGAVSVFVAFIGKLGKLTPHLSKMARVRRLIRLLKLLRLLRLVRLLEISEVWWLCWGLAATFFIMGSWTILESVYQEELKLAAAQLDFTSVRDAVCSVKEDQKRLFEAIKGKEDEIDSAINTLRSAGRFDKDVRSLMDLGITVSRKKLRYNIHKAIHTGLLWGIFCVSGARDSVWWLSLLYPLISIACAARRRPRACRLNFAVLSWRRPVWAGMAFSILLHLLNVKGRIGLGMVYFVKYAARYWATAAAAMGPNTAVYIYHRLMRDPHQYALFDWFLLLCIVIIVHLAMGCSVFFYFDEMSCIESVVGKFNFTDVKFGGKDFGLIKQCYFRWAAYYHIFLIVFGLCWTQVGERFERRIQKKKETLISVSRTSSAVVDDVDDCNVDSTSRASLDSTAPLQWVEMAERRLSHSGSDSVHL